MRKLIACLAVATVLTGCNTVQKTEPTTGTMAAGMAPASAQNAEGLVGRWSGNLPNGASILLDIPKSGKPSYQFRGSNVAVVSARASGNSLVLSVGRGYGSVTVTPSGSGLAYMYSDREGTAKATLTRS